MEEVTSRKRKRELRNIIGSSKKKTRYGRASDSISSHSTSEQQHLPVESCKRATTYFNTNLSTNRTSFTKPTQSHQHRTQTPRRNSSLVTLPLQKPTIRLENSIPKSFSQTPSSHDSSKTHQPSHKTNKLNQLSTQRLSSQQQGPLNYTNAHTTQHESTTHTSTSSTSYSRTKTACFLLFFLFACILTNILLILYYTQHYSHHLLYLVKLQHPNETIQISATLPHAQPQHPIYQDQLHQFSSLKSHTSNKINTTLPITSCMDILFLLNRSISSNINCTLEFTNETHFCVNKLFQNGVPKNTMSPETNLSSTYLAMEQQITELYQFYHTYKPFFKCMEQSNSVKSTATTTISSSSIQPSRLAENSKMRSSTTHSSTEKDTLHHLQNKNSILLTQIEAYNQTIQKLQDTLQRSKQDLFHMDLQVLDLVDVKTDHANIIHDLTITNQKLRYQIHNLKMNMEQQMDEAVAAVDAVASMSNIYKTESMNVLSRDMQRSIELQMMEAAAAINMVASTSSQIKTNELRAQEQQMDSRMNEAIHAMNAVATAANQMKKDEIDRYRAYFGMYVTDAIASVGRISSAVYKQVTGDLTENIGI